MAAGRSRRAVALTIFALLAVLAVGAGAASAAGSGSAHHVAADRQSKPKAAQRPIYWGAWIGSQITGAEAPWDMSAVSTLAGMVGKSPSLIEFSSPLANCEELPCSFYKFPTEQMQRIRDYGAIPFFSWNTASLPYNYSDASDPGYQLHDIIDGKFDAPMLEFARAAAAWGHPFFLRFDWEMNGAWFPWSESVNGNQRGEYVAAWRHVHDLFASVGATNASWVWCPYPGNRSQNRNLRSLYPGNRYVDWTCLDAFNWGQNQANPQPWRSFDEIVHDSYRLITKKIAPKKPMLMAETASNGSPAAKSKWIDRMFEQLATKYRRVRGLIWFDKVDRGIDWPLETSRATIRSFRRGLRSPAFRDNQYGQLATSSLTAPR